MTERFYRIILGVILMVIVYFELNYAMFVYVGLLFIEGATNWRVPTIISHLRYGKNLSKINISASRINIEAEQILRLIIAVFVIISYFLYPELLWFFPWFVGIMLLSAGLTNICPMGLSLKWIGFK